MWFYALIITLLIVLAWLTRVRESFIDFEASRVDPKALQDVDLSSLPAPQEVFKQLRKLIDKYDTPEVWGHAAQVMDKDPGQLARMNLGIVNKPNTR
jgi:hypothetical protein